MKKFIPLFVLIIGLTVISANAQESTQTPTQLYVASELIAPTIYRLNSGQNVRFGFWIYQESYTITANEVVFTATLPTGVNFISATSTHGSCSPADGVITCNMGTLTKYYGDYTAVVSIYVQPTVAGQITVSGKIKGSNTPEVTFSQTKTVEPEKSRKRIRFF